MRRYLSFWTAAGIAAVMVVLSLVNRGSGTDKVPQWSATFGAMLLLYLLLAAVVPVLMVPLGLVILLAQVLDSGLPSWAQKVMQGPEGMAG